MKCPACDGKGGFTCYFGEYDECDVCNETGKVTRARAKRYHDELAAEDARIDALMAAPCPLRGVPEGNHVMAPRANGCTELGRRHVNVVRSAAEEIEELRACVRALCDETSARKLLSFATAEAIFSEGED